MEHVEPTEMRYQGKAKRVWRTTDPALSIIEFTDSATAFNGEKRAEIAGKGPVNCATSVRLFELLEESGVRTHLVRQLDDRQILAHDVEIVPLEVVVRNVVAGSLRNRTGLPEGHRLREPIVELYFKRDDLGDPLLNRSHIAALGIADADLVTRMELMARRVNDVLVPWLEGCGIQLVDFKLEFGLAQDGSLLLADEISPDTCRFWDSQTGEKLDKDRFRFDMGGVEGAYATLLDRVLGAGVGA